MQVEAIPIDKIIVAPRMRDLRPEWVERLAESIKEVGLRQPITVVPATIVPHGNAEDGYELVTGFHRLRACESLGHKDIPAIVSDMSDLDQQLWEIDENFIRCNLTELEQAEHLAVRKDIYIARHPETRHHAAGAHGANAAMGRANNAGDNLSFASDTAAKLGIDERTIQRAVRRAERISPQVKQMISATPIANKGVELDALASLHQTPDLQVKAAKMVIAGKADSVREAKHRLIPRQVIVPDHDEASVKRIDAAKKAVAALSVAERRAFHEWYCALETPIFDNTAAA